MENMEDILVPIVLFLTVGIVVSLNFYYRYRTRQSIQATVRTAIEQGQPLTPEVLESLSDSLSSKHSDLRRGVISVAIGIALFSFAQLIGEPDAEGPMRALAAFPLHRHSQVSRSARMIRTRFRIASRLMLKPIIAPVMATPSTMSRIARPRRCSG